MTTSKLMFHPQHSHFVSSQRLIILLIFLVFQPILRGSNIAHKFPHIMANCFTPTQSGFKYCHNGPFLTTLRQNVMLLPLSKPSPLPHGVLSFLSKPLPYNVVVCQSFMCLFNCNSITSHLLVVIHGLSTAIKQRRFGRFAHHYHCRAFISFTWTHLLKVRHYVTRSQ
jgi:hypothetical protein